MPRYILFLSVLCLLVGCQAREPVDNEFSSNGKKVLLVSFDGFRNDYPEFTETPNFDRLAERGVTSEGLMPVFPSKTFPAHYSIATGLYPENSGLTGNDMYDPEFDAYYAIRDREAVEDPRWYIGEPIWNTVEKQGKKAGTMFWVGSEAPIQDMRPTHWKRYDQSISSQARVDTVLKWLKGGEGTREVDFATLYFSYVDSYGHRHGIESDSIHTAIRRADRDLGYLTQRIEEEGLIDQLNLLVVSDHGMSELHKDRVILLDEIIDPDDLVRRVGGSPVIYLYPEEEKNEELYQSLKEAENHYRIYRKEELPERLHLKNSRRVGDLVMVADSGYTITTTEWYDSFVEGLPSATHGFDNRDEQMHAFFLAAGPDFKEGERIDVFESIHLYELMAYLLDLNPAPNDGSLDSVRVLLEGEGKGQK